VSYIYGRYAGVNEIVRSRKPHVNGWAGAASVCLW
jgi:hypothetical protein